MVAASCGAVEPGAKELRLGSEPVPLAVPAPVMPLLPTALVTEPEVIMIPFDNPILQAPAQLNNPRAGVAPVYCRFQAITPGPRKFCITTESVTALVTANCALALYQLQSRMSNKGSPEYVRDLIKPLEFIFKYRVFTGVL